MLINIKDAIKHAEREMKNPLIQAIVLGSSGAGKSRLLGSFGVKTLYLYGTGEDHGPKSARAGGADNVIPVCYDYGQPAGEKAERYFTADETIKLISEMLRDHALLKDLGVKAIAIDGFANLEHIVKKSNRWADKCKTSQGKHNTFKETEASLEVLTEIVDGLKMAQRALGVHIAVTCMIDVKGLASDGSITEAAPRLSGYMLAEPLLQQFGDVIVVGKMSRNGQTKYKLQFMTDLAKASKDEVGDLKRAMNFNPRLSGVKTLPSYLDADNGLAAVAELKVTELK